jgi:hypothetical protein
MNADWRDIMSIMSLVATIGGGLGFVLVTRTRVERVEADIRDLRTEKASKEALDGLRSSIADLRLHMDAKFQELREDLRGGRDG